MVLFPINPNWRVLMFKSVLCVSKPKLYRLQSTISLSASCAFLVLLYSLNVSAANVSVANVSKEWQLDNSRSAFSFVSIKAGNIAETHQFTEMSGSVSGTTGADIAINTASVDTLIPIRDERMQTHLFESLIFPTIRIQADVDEALLSEVQNNGTVQQDVNTTVVIKDRTINVQAAVLAAMLSDGSVIVTTTKPVLLNAAAVGLDRGVEKLRELAGLPSISQAVPVTFSLVFTATEN